MHEVTLAMLGDNPYQGREGYDQGKIVELAGNIHELKDRYPATKGLLQVPLARLVDTASGEPAMDIRLSEIPHGSDISQMLRDMGLSVELAFGHRRREAFWLIANTDDIMGRDPDYDTMPVVFADLSDEDMAIAAFTENLERDNPTPIEHARMIATIMEEFDWTQLKTAKELGMTRPRLSNIVRLTKLPHEWQEALIEGEISERQAAAILPVVDLPDAVINRAGVMGSSIDRILRRAKDGLPSDKVREEAKTLIARGSLAFQNNSTLIVHVREEYGLDNEAIVQEPCLPLDDQNRCPMMIKHGAHWRCGNEDCFSLKKDARLSVPLAEAAEKLGLPTISPSAYRVDYSRYHLFYGEGYHEHLPAWLETGPMCLHITSTDRGYGAMQPPGYEGTTIYYCCTEDEDAAGCTSYSSFRADAITKTREADGEQGKFGTSGADADWQARQAQREAERQQVIDDVVDPAGEIFGKALNERNLGAWQVLADIVLPREYMMQLDTTAATIEDYVNAVAWFVIERQATGMAEHNVEYAKRTMTEIFGYGNLDGLLPWADTLEPIEEPEYEQVEEPA